MALVQLDVGDIYFSQNSINAIFKEEKTTLVDTFQDLLLENIKPSDFPPITVVKYNNEYFAYDGNRRLFLFKVSQLSIKTNYNPLIYKLVLEKRTAELLRIYKLTLS